MLKLALRITSVLAGAFMFTSVHATEPPLTFPEGWKVTEEAADDSIDWTASLESGAMIEASIMVSKMPLDQNVKADLPHALDDLLAKAGRGVSAPEVSQLGISLVSCGDRREFKVGAARAMAGTCNIAPLGKSIMVLVDGKENTYFLNYLADFKFYDKHLPAWEEMLKSARIQ